MSIDYTVQVIFGVPLEVKETVTETSVTRYDEKTGVPYEKITKHKKRTIFGIDIGDYIDKLEEKYYLDDEFGLYDMGHDEFYFGILLESLNYNDAYEVPKISMVIEEKLNRELNDINVPKDIIPSIHILFQVG